MFDTLQDFSAALAELPEPCEAARTAARQRQAELTKPAGSLGRLEECAVFLAGWSRTHKPQIEHAVTLVFAGNHGVTAQGVSPYPPEVTAQMVANFSNGGAAINAITASVGSKLKAIPLELDRPTGDISSAPAMSDDELLLALRTGADAVPEACDLVALGEMGIGNTTIAAALAASCFGGDGAQWCGPGTGLDPAGVQRKANVVDRALAQHAAATSATARLAALGGRELAAIAGAIVKARHRSIAVVLDGFVTTAALAPLFRDNSGITAHCLAGHVSAEPAHARLLREMQLEPLLDLNMRLGEGSGAALSIGLLRAAVATHNGMATFAEAAVSNRPQNPAVEA